MPEHGQTRTPRWVRCASGSLPDAQAIAHLLATDGAVLVEQLTGREAVLELARTLMTVAVHPDGDPDGLTLIRDTGRTGQPGLCGFGHGELLPHTEGSALKEPPRLMVLACARPADTGGSSHIVDGQAVMASLHRSDLDALQRLTVPRTALFGGSGGQFAPVFAQAGADLWSVRLRLDDLVRFSPQAQSAVPALREAIEAHKVSFTLRAGQAVILDNHRVLHARSAFSGPRLMLRAVGPAQPGFPLPDGFAPPWASDRPRPGLRTTSSLGRPEAGSAYR